MSDLQPHISRIAQKLQQLLKQVEHVKKENEKLRADVKSKEEQLLHKDVLLAELDQKVAILKTAAGNMDDKSKKEFDKKITGYIKDVDKVIAHLNG